MGWAMLMCHVDVVLFHHFKGKNMRVDMEFTNKKCENKNMLENIIFSFGTMEGTLIVIPISSFFCKLHK